MESTWHNVWLHRSVKNNHVEETAIEVLLYTLEDEEEEEEHIAVGPQPLTTNLPSFSLWWNYSFLMTYLVIDYLDLDLFLMPAAVFSIENLESAIYILDIDGISYFCSISLSSSAMVGGTVLGITYYVLD